MIHAQTGPVHFPHQNTGGALPHGADMVESAVTESPDEQQNEDSGEDEDNDEVDDDDAQDLPPVPELPEGSDAAEHFRQYLLSCNIDLPGDLSVEEAKNMAAQIEEIIDMGEHQFWTEYVFKFIDPTTPPLRLLFFTHYGAFSSAFGGGFGWLHILLALLHVAAFGLVIETLLCPDTVLLPSPSHISMQKL